jgi:hypothetical protein
LAEQQELCKGRFADLIGKLAAKDAERRRLALNQFGRPVKIMRVAELGFHHAEKGVVLQPMMMIVAELLVF